MPGGGDLFQRLLVDLLVAGDDDFAGLGMSDIGRRHAADDALRHGRQQAFLLRLAYPDAVRRAAVLVGGDDVLGHVDEAAGKVAGVRSPQGGVRQALAGAVRRDEVLQHAVALAQAGLDGEVDDLAGGVGHQAAHAGHLAYLGDVTLGAGGGHHVDAAVAVEVVRDGVGDIVGGLHPRS